MLTLSKMLDMAQALQHCQFPTLHLLSGCELTKVQQHACKTHVQMVAIRNKNAGQSGAEAWQT